MPAAKGCLACPFPTWRSVAMLAVAGILVQEALGKGSKWWEIPFQVCAVTTLRLDHGATSLPAKGLALLGLLHALP